MKESLDQVIKNRRSIYPGMYSGEPIEDEVIMDILENANWAPNHRKTEPWRFKVFKEDALIRLGEYLAEAYKENTPEDKFNERKYKKKKTKILKASHVIGLCIKRDPEGLVPEWEELAALSCAVQNMYLSCTAREIGCYWSSPSSIVGTPAILKLTEGEQCYGLMYIGKPIEGLELKAERGDVADKTTWISE